MPVFIGGRTSVLHRDGVVAAGAVPLGEDIDAGVHRLLAQLNADRNSK